MPLNLMQRFSGSRAATMDGAATRGAPSKAEGKTSGGETRCVRQSVACKTLPTTDDHGETGPVALDSAFTTPGRCLMLPDLCREDGRVSFGYSTLRGKRASMEDFLQAKVDTLLGGSACVHGVLHLAAMS